MSSVAAPTSIVQFDAALRDAAVLAHVRYPGEYPRLNRGLVLALNGAVTLHADGTASVQSASNAEIVYTVNGHCDCPDASQAPDGRCKHRWAKALARKAQTMLLDAHRFFASYTAPDGAVHGGIVVRTPSGWLFCPDDGGDLLYASAQALALGGICY